MYSKPAGINALPKHQLKMARTDRLAVHAFLALVGLTQVTLYAGAAARVKDNVLYSASIRYVERESQKVGIRALLAR